MREILLHVVHSERWLQPQLMLLRRAVAPAPAHARRGRRHPARQRIRRPAARAALGLSTVREDTERLLSDLTPLQLREPANLELDGEVLDLSLRSMALTAADHQLTHVRQIQRILGPHPLIA